MWERYCHSDGDNNDDYNDGDENVDHNDGDRDDYEKERMVLFLERIVMVMRKIMMLVMMITLCFIIVESSSSLLPLSLAGVEFRAGSNKWLKNNLLNSYIHFVPLGTALRETQLSCVVYKKRVGLYHHYPLSSST